MNAIPTVIYIDVDDTLIRTAGSKQIPISAAVDFVQRKHAQGCTLYCWSRGGGEYSRQVAESLGIAECFSGFLPKPDVLLDDRLEQVLSHCLFIHPHNAAAE